MKTKTKKLPEKSPPVSTPDDTAGMSRFEQDAYVRGEAAELTPEGKLPQDATHAIVKKPDGTRALKRVRFKMV